MKKTLLTLGTLALLASPSFAVEDNLQEHLKMQEKLEKKERLKDGTGGKNQYKHQKKHQYKGTNPDRSSTGMGKRMGGGGKGR